MATILGNPQEIQAPSPGTRRYGIFNAAVRPGEASDRVIASGITFPAEDCGMAVVPYDPTCAAPHPEKDFEPGTAFVESAPYWLLTTYQCGTVGTSAADVQRRVRRRYDAGAQWAVEQMIWTGGGITGVPNLSATAPANVVVPTAPGAGAAIAALEQTFHDQHGYTGVIHMNTAGYAAAQYAGLATPQGGAGVLRTPLGNAWSFGSGYGITGPAGVAPAAGFVWAFITPQVYLWETAVNQPDPVQTLDRTFNQWMAVAESVWAHAWACNTVYAVQVPVAAPAVATAPAVPA
jgi:hypothetical protein